MLTGRPLTTRQLTGPIQVPGKISDRDYHGAADAWCNKYKPHTTLCLVQFKDIPIDQMPKVYLATPKEIAEHHKKSANGRGETILYEYKEWTDRAVGAGTTDKIPEQWKFSADRIQELFLIS